MFRPHMMWLDRRNHSTSVRAPEVMSLKPSYWTQNMSDAASAHSSKRRGRVDTDSMGTSVGIVHTSHTHNRKRSHTCAHTTHTHTSTHALSERP